MKQDGIFTLHHYTVSARLNRPQTLLCFSDVHREAPLHATDHWKRFLKRLNSDKEALVLGLGDYLDGCSTSERKIIHELHESTEATLAGVIRGHTTSLANELKSAKGRTLGLIGGNHYYPLKGGSSDTLLASLLGTTYLGCSSIIRLTFDLGKDGTIDYDIGCHHGTGGGSTPGATFNNLEKMLARFEVDLVLSGHDHKKGCIPSSPRMRPVTMPDGSLVLRERTPWLGRTGSFLKSYVPDQVSYNVDAGRSPCALGHIEFHITPVKRNGILELEVSGTS
jgi:hypothetical protein